MKDEVNTEPLYILVVHGSRDENSIKQSNKFFESLKNRCPDRLIELAYIEINQPLLEDVLIEKAKVYPSIIVLPLLIFRANHVLKDIPRWVGMAKEINPKTEIEIADILRPGVPIANIINDICFEISDYNIHKVRETTLVLVGRGSSNPLPIADFEKMKSFIEDLSEFNQVELAYVNISFPNLTEKLESLLSLQKSVIVVPYLLFIGKLYDTIISAVDSFKNKFQGSELLVSKPLGGEKGIIDLFVAEIEK